MSKIEPGKYNAKVVDYSVIENDKGEPVVVIKFSFDQGKTWAWTGSFGSEKARERTLKTLMVVGLRDDNLEKLCDGPTSNMLDTDKEVEIVVETTEYEGKTRTQITYVNPIGGRAFGEAITQDKAKVKFGGMNISAQLAAYGFKKAEVKKESSLDSIPF